MNFFHLSDLHIGKYLNGFNLGENQETVLGEIVRAAEKFRPGAVLICGDIYDKNAPSGEAYDIFDRFLSALSATDIPILITAGNHDSPERLKYAAGFLEKHNITIAALPPDNEVFLKKVTLFDSFGPVNFYMAPFISPGRVRKIFPEGQNYESAFRAVLSREKIDFTQRNVLLAHQFFTAGENLPETCDSERPAVTVGGLDRIDVSAVEDFDYVALGHLHGPQRVGPEKIRYCGSPYKYSLSEERHKKSITFALLGKKGSLEINHIPLFGKSDVRRVKGTLKEIIAAPGNRGDFVGVTITDEAEPPDLRDLLSEIYKNLLEIRVENSRTKARGESIGEEISEDPLETFRRFYETVRLAPMTPDEELAAARAVERARENE